MKPITLFLSLIISIHLNAQIAEIPFELKNGIILLDVNINDKTEANTFIFDTGATSDLLDSTAADKLGLEANYKHDVSGAGGTKSYDIILIQKLKLQNKIKKVIVKRLPTMRKTALKSCLHPPLPVYEPMTKQILQV